MMIKFRQDPPKSLGGSGVSTLIDYKTGEQKDLTNNVSSKINFPSSNVLQFITEDGSKISVRPSGTEPKIKFYFSVNTELDDLEKYDETAEKLKQKTNKIMEELGL